MTLKIADRVFETTTSTGTGSITLAGAVQGFQSFSVIGTTIKVPYYIDDADNTGIAQNWEAGLATVTVAGPVVTLSRDTIFASSNANIVVNFGAGTKNVRGGIPAAMFAILDENLNFVRDTAINTTGSTANVITMALAYVPLAYSEGMKVDFKVPITNTTAGVTLNVNGKGAVALKVAGSDPGVGNLIAGRRILAEYNATTGFFDILAGSNIDLSAYALKGANSDITSLAALASINDGPLAGFRNLIINGNCSVWQRGTSFTNQTFGGAIQYAQDRWIGNRDSDVNGQIISRYAITSADRTAAGQSLPRYGVQWQRVAGNSAVNGMNQFYAVETADSLGVAGKTVTFSIYAKAGANYSGGLLTMGISYGTGTDQREPNFTGLTTVTATKTLTTSMQQFSVTATIPVTATQVGIRMTWTPVGTAGGDDSVYYTAADLSIGSVAPVNVENRPFATELALCRRYYQKTFPYAIAPAQNAGLAGALFATASVTTAGSMGVMWRYPVALRSTGGVTTYNPSAANTSWRNVTSSTDAVASIDPNSTNSSEGVVIKEITTALVVGANYYIHAQADAEL